MDILWQPELGECSHCGRKSKRVRRFTTGNRHTVFCFSCWNKVQHKKHGYRINRNEWVENIAVKFEHEIQENSKTQELVVWH